MARLPKHRPAESPGVTPLGGGAGIRSTRVWAPFEKENAAAVTHGAYSPKVRQPRAQELVDWLLEQPGLKHIHDESFLPAVWRWAQRQAMADLLLAALAEHHEPTPCAGCKKCKGWESRWQIFDRTAEKAGAAIGLDPQSRADLLARMTVSGLLDTAGEVQSMLGNLWEQLQQDAGAKQMADYVETLQESMRAKGLEVPEPPADLVKTEEVLLELREQREAEDL